MQGNIVAFFSSILPSSFKRSDDCRTKELSACSIILSYPFSLIQFTAQYTLTFFSFHSLLINFSWQILIIFLKSANVIFWVLHKLLINSLFNVYISSLQLFHHILINTSNTLIHFSKTRDNISSYSCKLCMIVMFSIWWILAQ